MDTSKDRPSVFRAASSSFLWSKYDWVELSTNSANACHTVYGSRLYERIASTPKSGWQRISPLSYRPSAKIQRPSSSRTRLILVNECSGLPFVQLRYRSLPCLDASSGMTRRSPPHKYQLSRHRRLATGPVEFDCPQPKHHRISRHSITSVAGGWGWSPLIRKQCWFVGERKISTIPSTAPTALSGLSHSGRGRSTTTHTFGCSPESYPQHGRRPGRAPPGVVPLYDSDRTVHTPRREPGEGRDC